MSTASDLEWLMLDLINQERAAYGLNPLQLEVRLNDSSEDHSLWMLQTDTFSHTGAEGSNAWNRMVDADFVFSGSWGAAENIAWQSERGAAGFADDVENLHNLLMNSPGHRANILNPNYEVIGIGIEIGNYNGWEAVMATQNFAYTSASLQIDSRAPITAPPVLTVDTMALNPGSWFQVSDAVGVQDLDGDTPTKYQIKDKTGLIEYSVNGQLKTPVNDKITVTANKIEDLLIRTEDAGIRKQLTFRAKDDDGWSKWEQFNVMSRPDDDIPLVAVENMVFSEDRNTTKSLADHLTVLDRTDDTIRWYQLLDKSGQDNFIFKGQGAIQADRPYRVMAEDLDQILVRGETEVMKSNIKVRAFDGENLSGWETFVLHTVPDDDPWLTV